MLIILSLVAVDFLLACDNLLQGRTIGKGTDHEWRGSETLR